MTDSAVKPLALSLSGVHHVAVIASDYARSRQFYTEVLGLAVVHELYRAEQQSYKLDLQLPGARLIAQAHPPRQVPYYAQSVYFEVESADPYWSQIWAGSAMAQMTPVGAWQTIDDETSEVKSQIRIDESGGVLSGRIEWVLLHSS